MKMELDGLWRIYRGVPVCLLMVITWFCVQSLIAVSLNDEGMALLRFKDRIENDPFGALLTWKESSLANDHCSWYGVDCVDGNVVSLKLKDLCLAGTLAPEFGHLVHIKLIILRNNSLSGAVPEEIAGLKELEVLDLGFNNFSGPLPHEWGHNVAVLLLDNNGEFCHVPHEVEQLMMISEVQVDESDLSSISEDSSYNVKLKSSCVAEHAKTFSHTFTRFDHQTKDHMHRRELQESTKPHVIVGPPLDAAPSLPPTPAPAPAQPPPPPPSQTSASSPPTPASNPTPSPVSSHRINKLAIAIPAAVGGFILVAVIVALLFWKRKKFATVGPRGTGMNRRTQRSHANGDDKIQILSRSIIPDAGLSQGIANLQRSELESACEEFSNVIGSSSIGTLYKGTLSSGGEIAVLTYAVKHPQEWSDHMQTLFKKKVDMLTKVSHKNFLNLIGYCEEEKPFTRMLVFEYAPSGTLFEHLYVRESEHLDWTMRLRIVMGITYCLEHMHTLTPSITHEDLTAYAVNLSEDYAAKLSAFGIWNEVALAARPLPVVIKTATSPETNPEDNVYSFGLLLLETMTGKAPHSMGSTSSLDKWASDFLRGEKPLKDFVDPMLRHVDTAQLEKISEVIKSCTLPDPNERPRMEDVALSLTEVTGVAPNRAAPRLSPWWPDIESQSSRSHTVASE